MNKLSTGIMRKAAERKSAASFKWALDFYFVISEERRPGFGEDSYLLDVQDDRALAVVFDGCGGSGALVYPEYGGHTGAWLASRIAAQGTQRWFLESEKEFCSDNLKMNDDLQKVLSDSLKQFQEKSRSQSSVLNSMNRYLPSTTAGILLHRSKEYLTAEIFWAGDSRCYLLTREGLCQLTEDDLAVKDAFINLREDAALRNVLSASSEFQIHQHRFFVSEPCILFAATDGCFGYLKTPMAFEIMLLETLMRAECIQSWKQSLCDIWKKVAGDDFTMVAMGTGFGNFGQMKRFLSGRLEKLHQMYPDSDSEQEMEAQWQTYRVFYESLLPGHAREETRYRV